MRKFDCDTVCQASNLEKAICYGRTTHNTLRLIASSCILLGVRGFSTLSFSLHYFS